MDDNYVIKDNEQVQQGISAIPDIFTSFYVQLDKMTFYYRPIPKVLFALEYEIFGNNPHAFHFIQVMGFVLLIYVMWLFFLQLFGEEYKKSIFWGLMLFVAFPTNTEIIASLKNIDIILAGLFAFLALRFFLQFHDRKKWWTLLISFTLLFLAVISKQDGLLYWVAGATGILVLRDKKIRNFVIAAAFTIAAFGLYRIIIHQLGHHERVIEFYENPLFGEHSRLLRISTGFGVIWFYLKMLVIPYPLSYYYGYKILDIFKFNDWQVWAGFAVMTALFIFAILQFKKKKTLTRQYHPIINLDYVEGLDEFSLQDDVLIKKLSDDEINNLIRMNSFFHKNKLTQYAVVFDYYEEIGFCDDKKLNEPEIIKKIPAVLELLLCSLNLTTKGGFLFNTVHTLHLDYFSNFSGMSTSSSYATDSPRGHRIHKEAFKEWCKKYNELSQLEIGHFKLALSRLSEAERRLNPIDSIIDSIIGLESILLNDIGNKNTQGELRFRFALNYASMFSKEERSEEHTSELQSHSFTSYAVFCLKKKNHLLSITTSY